MRSGHKLSEHMSAIHSKHSLRAEGTRSSTPNVAGRPKQKPSGLTEHVPVDRLLTQTNQRRGGELRSFPVGSGRHQAEAGPRSTIKHLPSTQNITTQAGTKCEPAEASVTQIAGRVANRSKSQVERTIRGVGKVAGTNQRSLGQDAPSVQDLRHSFHRRRRITYDRAQRESREREPRTQDVTGSLPISCVEVLE
ncbi:hypothetical protein pipiens_011319 [Culex pipiens pipiens]|uniref:Uncharacterized protein n=1 Tax=Culex pipiens pipiens TaxID=38569 RepID=A0ABD1D7L9_CULPP